MLNIPVYVPTGLPNKVNPWWVVGLTEGEGCFSVDVYKNQAMRLGATAQLNFNVTQLALNRIILDSYRRYQGKVEFFNCGVSNNRNNGTLMFRVRDINDITRIIIPFFKEHPMVGRKHLDFLDFSPRHSVISLLI